MAEEKRGLIAGIVKHFLDARLSMILIIISLCLGIAALLVTPREEEPQITVPLADIYVNAPGASPEEVEQLVATPLERLLWQIDGVEYVYSMSRKDMAVATVRFFVGEDRENSLIKLHNRIAMHIDKVSPIIRGWVIKPMEIDDVPMVTFSLYSKNLDDAELYRVGQEVLARLSRVKNISRTSITLLRTTPGFSPAASRTRAIFSYTVRLGISLKSWNMIPNLRRRKGTRPL